MNDLDKKMVSAIVSYIIVGFICFGWRYNHPDPPRWEHLEQVNENERQQNSVVSGIFWPVWLLGTFTIQVTRWP